MKKKKIHMTGIGGIGMSALAQLFIYENKQVTGSDREDSPVTELLSKAGINLIIGQKAENITEDIDLLVYSDAVPEDNPERMRAKELGIQELSYFEALGRAVEGKRVIAISGTHGKTTTSAMLARILQDCGKSPTAIIGSIVKDFNSNFLSGESDIFVVEACEYRNHLLELSPEVLVITNLEWDHSDFFPTFASLQETFKKAIRKVPENGVIITNPNDPNIAPLLKGAPASVVDYTKEDSPELLVLGEFNRDNARAAKATAKYIYPSLSESAVDQSLKTYGGTWRRFEYKGKTKNGAEVYDDYAHHPTAIEKTVKAVRERFKDKRIVVAFHPHLYSRTRDFFEEFASALALPDRTIIAPIYAAREAHDEKVSHKTLSIQVQKNGGHAEALDSFEEIAKALEEEGTESLIITMGAGDIYKVSDRIIAA
jgi:UDP-N-acetylmuramate--alanine ligase